MKETDRNAIIKLYVGDGLKAKLKALASMRNMTFTDLFMDAILAKYPYLVGRRTDGIEELQKMLAEVLEQLANSSEMPEDKKSELKGKKYQLKKQIKRLAHENEQISNLPITE